MNFWLVCWQLAVCYVQYSHDKLLLVISRKIQGPFSKPGDPSALKRSIITNGDYKNANLLKADPGKVFLLDWDDEFYDDFEVNNRLITHGRYISKYDKIVWNYI